KDLKSKLKMSLILITHDLSIIAEVADKVAIMYAGKIVEWGTSEQIFLTPKHPYTAGLVASIPKLRGDKSLYWIPGQPPDLINPPPGCRFYPRCAKRMEICKTEEPPMTEVEPDHYVACWLYSKR
ncbi:MAG: ABC transporter ATP-binding protein, partial [Desulfurococcales archaeon]|nr:ABC transporter ATP-binding protein [Desulfurococcales archaeon]